VDAVIKPSREVPQVADSGQAAGPGAAGGQGPGDRIDRDVFRDVIGRFVSGVSVVTTAVGGEQFAATVSALASVSLEPPMLLVCLNRTSATQEAITRSGRFAVSILAEHQHRLARWFATKEAAKLDAGVAAAGPAGLPVIRGRRLPGVHGPRHRARRDAHRLPRRGGQRLAWSRPAAGLLPRRTRRLRRHRRPGPAALLRGPAGPGGPGVLTALRSR
jgi:hypothetical protein